jgi:hypothetical protein
LHEGTYQPAAVESWRAPQRPAGRMHHMANDRTAHFSGNRTGMPIRPFLANQAFEPETIRDMSLALEKVCDALSLRMVDDAATRLIAEKIIELAQRGVQDVATLTAMTLKEFKRTD